MLRLIKPENPEAEIAPREMHYWAFLSYSHHDKAVAKRLQRQLETYRLPRRLVGRETSVGPVPTRASPVFRDRDELHAGADLKASVQDALARSRWLIVVCTPDAARSPWVNREIIEFKRLRGERHVLALIAAGEPFASDMPGREAEECFPPALRRALNEQGVPEGQRLEPIAADMRKHGDGPQRAMLKLLAGMVGVGFDDLVRRDMQRRVRWLSGLAGASALGVLVFALMAVMAVRARNDAQLQRVQAEGLIEFMLGDLRKKLEPVGRLEVLDSVGEKALAYYGAQEAGKLDANALGQRSRALHLIGEIRDLRGNPAQAQTAFEQAERTTAQLLAQSPNDGQRLFNHAQSVFWVGYAAWKRVDGKTAEAKFAEYLEFGQRLLKIDPANLDWQAEVAFANENLAAVQLGTDRPEEALKNFLVAGAVLDDLFSKRPALGVELGHSHAWLSSAYERLGDYENALKHQQAQLALFRTNVMLEKDRTAQRMVVNALTGISTYELILGRLPKAYAHARESLEMADDLVKTDPGNLLWRSDRCITRFRLAEVQLALGRFAQAQSTAALASDCAKVATADELGLSAFMKLQSRSIATAAVFVSQTNREAQAQNAQHFLDRWLPQVKSDVLDRAARSVDLANVALVLGELQTSTDTRASRRAWGLAETLLAPYENSRDGTILTALAKARYRLGDVDNALALLVRVQSSSYRHPAYVDLFEKLQAVRGPQRANLNSRN